MHVEPGGTVVMTDNVSGNKTRITEKGRVRGTFAQCKYPETDDYMILANRTIRTMLDYADNDKQHIQDMADTIRSLKKKFDAIKNALIEYDDEITHNSICAVNIVDQIMETGTFYAKKHHYA